MITSREHSSGRLFTITDPIDLSSKPGVVLASVAHYETNYMSISGCRAGAPSSRVSSFLMHSLSATTPTPRWFGCLITTSRACTRRTLPHSTYRWDGLSKNRRCRSTTPISMSPLTALIPLYWKDCVVDDHCSA